MASLALHTIYHVKNMTFWLVRFAILLLTMTFFFQRGSLKYLGKSSPVTFLKNPVLFVIAAKS